MATGILGSIEAMVLVDVSLVHAHHCLAVSWLLLQSLVDPHTAQGLLHVCKSAVRLTRALSYTSLSPQAISWSEGLPIALNGSWSSR